MICIPKKGQLSPTFESQHAMEMASSSCETVVHMGSAQLSDLVSLFDDLELEERHTRDD